MQNFDPAKASAAITDLCGRVQEIENVLVAGGVPLEAGVGAANDVLKIVEEFVPRLDAIEDVISLLLPILPVLQKMVMGEVAGTGETALQNITLPASELVVHGNLAAAQSSSELTETKAPTLAERMKAAFSPASDKPTV